MKVTIRTCIEPGYLPNHYSLDVHAVWNDGEENVAQRDILYTLLRTPDPTEDMDLRVWITALLRAAAESAEHDLVWSNEQGQAKLTLGDFKPLIT